MNKKTRNPIARLAIMGKGGVHEKTTKAKRQQEKQALKNKIRAEQFGSSFTYLLIHQNSNSSSQAY